jgi:hypothetical protein
VLPTTNRLLRALAPEDLDLLRPHLEPVPLPQRQTLSKPDTLIDDVYFPRREWCRLSSLWRMAP